MDDIDSVVRRCRLKAEELRATADHMANPFAQASFRRLAETYERLADDFSGIGKPKDSNQSKSG